MSSDEGALGRALAAEMSRRDVTQREAADLCGTSQQTFSKWMNGIHGPSEQALPNLAKFLGIPLADVRALVPARDHQLRLSSTKRLRALEERLERIALRQAAQQEQNAERLERLAARIDALAQLVDARPDSN